MSAPAGTGLLLVGRSGSGKTWVLRRLVDEHGFWTPTHVTTRPVDQTDAGTVHLSEEAFLAAVAAGELAAPMVFGAAWHAWAREDFARMCSGRERAVAVCRPYEALFLRAVQPRLAAVWLDAPAQVVEERRRERATERDLDEARRRARRDDDAEDARYRPLFEHVVSSEGDAVGAVLALVGVGAQRGAA